MPVDDEIQVSVVIPCLNEAENIERCVRRRARRRWTSHGIAGEVVVADNASEDGSAELAAARRRARRARAAARLRQRLPGRLRRRARALHRHGRRRPDLRLRRDPALRRAARRRRRARDGRPDGQHPAGRDAVAAPLRRQPGADRHPQRLLPHRRERRPLRHARASGATCCRGSTCARPAWSSPPRWSSGRRRRTSTSASSRSSTTRAAASRKLSSFRDGWRHLRFLLVHSPTHLFVLPGRAHAALLGALIALGRRCCRSTSSAARGSCTR